MKDLLATYYFIRGQGVTPQQAAQAICEGEAPGTRSGIHTRADNHKRLGGTVEEIKPHGIGYLARIRYPLEIFEPGNIAQHFSVLAGDLFSLSFMEAVRLVDIEFPDELVPYHGPKFGISGVRKMVGSTNRPHIGTVISPRMGLTPKDTAEVAYQAAIGGVDLVLDDMTLTNQKFCPYDQRIPEVIAKLDDAQSETGQQVLYAVNVTTRADRIVERAHHAITLGANMIMVDLVISGFSGLQALGEDPGIRVPVHVHRAMHAAMTQNPGYGISPRPISRVVRMLGGDQLRTGTVNGKMNHRIPELRDENEVLLSPEFGFKRTFPVVGGALHPGKVARELSVLGTDLVLLAGGGINMHPDGSAAGAKAMRQAVDAYIEGITAMEYARTHYELERALKLWEED